METKDTRFTIHDTRCIDRHCDEQGQRKRRLDEYLVDSGLCQSREQAKRLILAGSVVMEPAVIPLKPSTVVCSGNRVTLKARPRYVSRGGEKLEKALQVFAVHPAGLVFADLGASTGGFTDCLLQRGVRRVYAVDVGSGIIHQSLRRDQRVVLLEKTNARDLVPGMLGEPLDGLVVDVSFISLNLLWKNIAAVLKDQGTVIALVKPQFEAGRKLVGKGGVVNSPKTHRRVLESVGDGACEHGLAWRGLTFSPLRNPRGNIEFLGYLMKGQEFFDKPQERDIIEKTVQEAWSFFQGAP